MIIIKRFRMTKDHYIYLDQIQNKEFSRLPRSALYDCLSSPICFNISEIQSADNECLGHFCVEIRRLDLS